MRLLESLRHLQQNGILCDFELLSEDKKCVRIHSAVLAAASTTVCSYFTRTERRTENFKTDYTLSVLEDLVKYIYTGLGLDYLEVQQAAQELGINIQACVSTAVQTADNLENSYQSKAAIRTQACVAVDKEPDKTEGEDRHILESLISESILQNEDTNALTKAHDDHSDGDTPEHSDAEGADNNEDLPKTSPPETPTKQEKQEVDDDENETAMAFLNTKTDAGKKNTCTECGISFTKPLWLKEHKKVHRRKKHKCKDCEEFFRTTALLREHRRLHMEQKRKENQNVKCSTCGKTFRHRYYLSRHEMIHDVTERPFKCDLCGMAFKKEQTLMGHQVTHLYERKRPYTCTTCGKIFKVLNSLINHENKHGLPSNYVCDECGNSYKTIAKLKRHKWVHANPRYKCLLCPRVFKTKIGLNEHQHSHTGLRPFVCENCGMTFRQSTTLCKHRRIHTGERPYHCMICDKKFSTSFKLKKHTRVHTGEKPFVCDTCGKKFRQKSTLDRHNLVHTGERPFVCTLCDKAYNSRSALKYHQNRSLCLGSDPSAELPSAESESAVRTLFGLPTGS